MKKNMVFAFAMSLGLAGPLGAAQEASAMPGATGINAATTEAAQTAATPVWYRGYGPGWRGYGPGWRGGYGPGWRGGWRPGYGWGPGWGWAPFAALGVGLAAAGTYAYGPGPYYAPGGYPPCAGPCGPAPLK